MHPFFKDLAYTLEYVCIILPRKWLVLIGWLIETDARVQFWRHGSINIHKKDPDMNV